jgi:DNA-directed RNA polymerase specialized sigma subunit
MEAEYEKWLQAETPESTAALLTAAKPTIDSAVQAYGRGNPALRTKAKVLALGAFRSYDPNKGTKLRTHLMTQMQPLIRHARGFENIARIPERVSADLYLSNQAKKEFMDKHRRDPTDRELADATGLSTRRIAHVRGFARGDIAESGLKEMDEGENSIMYPGVAKPDPAQIWLEFVHHDSSPIDRQILEWKTGYNGAKILSTTEIAKKLGMTPGAVSQRAAKLATRLTEGQGYA